MAWCAVGSTLGAASLTGWTAISAGSALGRTEREAPILRGAAGTGTDLTETEEALGAVSRGRTRFRRLLTLEDGGRTTVKTTAHLRARAKAAGRTIGKARSTDLGATAIAQAAMPGRAGAIDTPAAVIDRDTATPADPRTDLRCRPRPAAVGAVVAPSAAPAGAALSGTRQPPTAGRGVVGTRLLRDGEAEQRG